MFGLLKKKLSDIVKKFSKEEEEKLQPDVQAEKPVETHPEEIKAAVETTETGKESAIWEPEKHEEKTISLEETPKIPEETVDTEEPMVITEAPEKKIEISKEEAAKEEEDIREFEKKMEKDAEETEIELHRLGVEEEISKAAEKLKDDEEKSGETFFEKELQESKAQELQKPPEPKTEASESGAERRGAEWKKIGFLGRIFGKKEEKTLPTKEIPYSKEGIAPETRKTENELEKIYEKIEQPAEKEKIIIPEISEAPEKPKAEPIAMPKEARKPGILGIITEKEISADEARKFADELKFALLESDVALEVAEKICYSLEKNMTGMTVKRGETEKMIKNSLQKSIVDILNQGDVDIDKIIVKAKSENRTATIIFLGFNGTGKTTTLAKFGYYLSNKGYKPIFAAGDTFRAASIEQIEIHAKKIGIDVVKQSYGSDSAAVIFDAREKARAGGYDVVLADTAGRSHSNANLMDELKKVIRVNKPDLKILVLDSLTGNDIVEQAQRFEESVGVDGIILTKADVYEKGGAALSASYAIKKPIIFIGVGQEYENLKKFDANEIASSLLG